MSVQLRLPRALIALDQTVISSPKNQLRSFVMAADLGGLDDKQAAAAAGMDPSTWSEFKNGKRGIKPLEWDGFMDQCGNELPLAHWAYRRGYSLVPLESEMERRLRTEQDRNDRLAEENALLRDLVQGKAGGIKKP